MTKQFLEKILAQKEQEVASLEVEKTGVLRPTYRLYDYLKANAQTLQVLAEVKKASPSMGDIKLGVDVVSQAANYQAAGAAMISVLTDEVFFKGDVLDLAAVSERVSIPTLAKDFIIDEKQIIRSFNAGATVILLIVAALSEERLRQLYQFATQLGLEVLVETHNLEELEIAHALGAEFIGVNNRDLKTFEVTLETTLALVPYFKEGPVYISESGIRSSEDAKTVAQQVSAVLVGTSLMQAEDVPTALKELQIGKD